MKHPAKHLRSLRHALSNTKYRLKNVVRASQTNEVFYVLEFGQFDGFEVAYRAGTSDEIVLRDSFRSDPFLRAMPDYRPEPDHTIVDVGAHIGSFALYLAAQVPQGCVHAIEASRETCNYLRVNAALNNFSNLHSHHLALAGEDGEAYLSHDSENWGHSIVKKLSPYGEKVEMVTLPHFMKRNKISTIHLMKLNCEGAEFGILMNTPPSTLEQVERMIILYHDDLMGQPQSESLLNYLQQANFEVEITNVVRQRGWMLARHKRLR